VHFDPAAIRPAATTADKKPAEPKVTRTAEPRPLKSAEAKPAKVKAEPVRLAARDPMPRSLLPADIGTLAAREAHGAKDSSKAAR